MSGVSKHNTLMEAIAAEAVRYDASGPGVIVDIGGPFTEGDPAHVEEHNRVCRALITLRDYANDVLHVTPTVVISLPPERFVGDVGHIDDHDTIDAALAVIQAVVIP